MMEPMVMAAIMPLGPMLPVARRTEVARRRLAMVMPDTGLLLEPIRPTIREETVAKKKPNRMTMIAPTGFNGMTGTMASRIARTTMPPTTTFMLMSLF